MSAPAPSSLLFVLGIQRSGTTWVANIFDASPDTLLFMEPFAPACGLFPDFPETGYFLNSAPPAITRLLRETMYRRLYRRKFLFLHRSLRSPSYFRFERGIARMAERFSKFAPWQLQRRVLQFSQLNLNRLDTFAEKLEAQAAGAEYKGLIAAAGHDIARRAALYWRVSYETMVRQLQGSVEFRLLAYEALASRPADVAGDYFEWAGIAWAPTVSSYLEYSSGADTENPAATNTVRHSRTYYSSWREKITGEVYQAVDEMVRDSFLLENFRPFYQSGGLT